MHGLLDGTPTFACSSAFTICSFFFRILIWTLNGSSKHSDLQREPS
jgi:hypothetical protein